jgi:uncharacterized protein YjcR
MAAAETAETGLRAAVVAALLAGGSVRELAKFTGMSTNTIQSWGRAGGWPSEEFKAARAEARRRNREFAQAVTIDDQAAAMDAVARAIDPDAEGDE